MRSLLVMLASALVALCGCSSTEAAPKAEVPYVPYTCIPPLRSAPPSPVPQGELQRIAVIGDSYTNGSPQGGTGENRWTSVATNELRTRGINVAIDIGAEGGSGYVHPGNRGGVFGDKVKTTVQPYDRLLVFFGTRNDSRAQQGELAHATCDAYREAEIAAPGAQLLIIGPVWPDAKPPQYILQARDIIRDRAKDLNARFVDPLADGWFLDRPDLIGADGVHPTDEGHAYMAQKIAPVMEQMLTEPAATPQN